MSDTKRCPTCRSERRGERGPVGVLSGFGFLWPRLRHQSCRDPWHLRPGSEAGDEKRCPTCGYCADDEFPVDAETLEPDGGGGLIPTPCRDPFHSPTPSPEKPSAEQERCPDCNGRGSRVVEHRNPNPETSGGGFLVCSTCKGTGKVQPASTEHPERRRWTIWVCPECGFHVAAGEKVMRSCPNHVGHRPALNPVTVEEVPGEAKDAG